MNKNAKTFTKHQTPEVQFRSKTQGGALGKGRKIQVCVKLQQSLHYSIFHTTTTQNYGSS